MKKVTQYQLYLIKEKYENNNKKLESLFKSLESIDQKETKQRHEILFEIGRITKENNDIRILLNGCYDLIEFDENDSTIGLGSIIELNEIEDEQYIILEDNYFDGVSGASKMMFLKSENPVVKTFLGKTAGDLIKLPKTNETLYISKVINGDKEYKPTEEKKNQIQFIKTNN